MKYGLLALALSIGCTTEPELESTSAAVTSENGQNLNGQNLNGQNLNGQNLNGQNLNGPDANTFMIWTSLENVKREGKTIARVSLDATVFSAFDGVFVWQGLDFTRMQFTGRRGDGRDVILRIREIVPAPDGWRYFVEYREDDLNWYPICEDASGARPAIPLNGIWDHRQGVTGGGSYIADPLKFTFACEGIGAIGKCVGAGYHPWESQLLADHHQACVRMLRGDYCGDGTPYTQNGNRVNLYDNIGVQEDTESWFFEAEWDTQGARCFNLLNRSRAGIPCYTPRVALFCGSRSNFGAGALLMNETPTLGLTP